VLLFGIFSGLRSAITYIINKKIETDLIKSYSTESSSSPSSPNPPKIVPRVTVGGKKPRKRKNRNCSHVLSPYQKEALIGLTLGDISVEKQTPNSNVRLRFDKSKDKHSDYLYFLFDIFKFFTLTGPKSTNRKPDVRTGKTYNSLVFRTRSLPCFNYLRDLFYPNGVKIIPACGLNISELLTPIALAFWIMDDGSCSTHNGVLILCTDSYTSSEVDLLIKVVEDKYGIKSNKALIRPNQWLRLRGCSTKNFST
jgi:hypothetical protein